MVRTHRDPSRLREERGQQAPSQTPNAVLALQRSAGNAAVTRLLQRLVGPGLPPFTPVWIRISAHERVAGRTTAPYDAKRNGYEVITDEDVGIGVFEGPSEMFRTVDLLDPMEGAAKEPAEKPSSEPKPVASQPKAPQLDLDEDESEDEPLPPETVVATALRLANQIAAREERHNRDLVVGRLRDECGIDLLVHPDIYDRIVEIVRASPITINFPLIFVEKLMRSKQYLNVWEKLEYTSGQDYARTRERTEMTLHQMPPIDPGGPASDKGTGAQSVPVGNELVPYGAPLSQASDRPHSAALNIPGYRAGGAINTMYGSSHVVFKENVKQRSTLTGGDSLEAIFKKGMGPEAVGTFQYLGAVLLHLDKGTLIYLAQRAVDPTAKPPKAAVSSLPYAEIQIFGALDVSKDVSEMVIDEDDLDLWEEGLLVDLYNPTKPVPKRTRKEIKAALMQFCGEHKIKLTFIRTGKSAKQPTAAGSQMLVTVAPWERALTKAFDCLRSMDWRGAQLCVHQIFSLAAPKAPDAPSFFARSDSLGAILAEIKELDAKKAGVKLDLMPSITHKVAGALVARMVELYQQQLLMPGFEEHKAELAANWSALLMALEPILEWADEWNEVMASI